MSDIATTRKPATYGRPLTYAAIGFALASVVVWVLAGIVDDALYTITGVLGVVALGLGEKARRDARRAGSSGRPALAAMVVGGLLGGAVIVATIVWALSHVV